MLIWWPVRVSYVLRYLSTKSSACVGGNKAVAPSSAGRVAGGGAVGGERPVPGVRDQVHAHHEETPLVCQAL